MKKKILIVLFILFAFIFLFCAFQIGKYFWESNQTKQIYDDLASLVEEAKPTAPPPEAPEVPVEPPSPYIDVTHPETGETLQVLREYAEVFIRNPDMIGWLKIDGTVINYPVMQTPGSADYYLKRDFYGNYSAHGCLYADESCDVFSPSDNIIIYGHNMKDGSMLAGLTDYTSKRFWEEHRYITFDTITEHRTYEVFAVFDISANGQGFAYHNFADADTEDEFYWFVNNCRQLSYYDTGVTANFGDSFVTLSTCEYTRANGRLVLVAKLIQE